MKNPSNALLAKIHAVNAVNAEINRLAPLYRAHFAPHVGERVTTNDGSLRKSAAKGLPSSSLQMFSPHKGCFVVKTHKIADGVAHYAENYFYAFTESREGICEPLKWEWVDYKTNYSAQEIMATREKIDKLRAELSDLESEVNPFANVY